MTAAEAQMPAGDQMSTQVLTVPEACAALRISRWSFYRLIQSRELTTIKIGSRRLVRAEDLASYLQRLAEESQP